MIRLKGELYLTPAEYSQKKGIREELVRRYCRDRRLPAVKASNRWFVPADSWPDGYEPRMKDGTYVGLNALRRGDVDTFLKLRGIIQ